MKILLLSPPTTKYLLKNARCDLVTWSGTSWWPIILGQLGAFLKGNPSFEVKLLDAQASGLTDEQVRAIVAEFDPDRSLIFTSRESLRGDLVWVYYLKDRKEGARACMASPFFFDPKAREISKVYELDFISGELELGFMDWLGGSKGWIRGPALTEEQYRGTGWASQFMATQCPYKDYMAPSEPYPFMDIMTGRGCSWGKCTFCLWPKTYRQKYITRDIDDVMDELEWIEQQKVFKGVMVEDDNLPDWRALDFSIQKMRRGIKIPWSCLTRAELSRETMQCMKDSGCLNIHIGYESGSDRTLTRVRKGLSRDQMQDFTKVAKKVGLRIHGDFQIGLDETEDEIYETIEWACRLRPHTAQFQIHIPYGGDMQPHHPDRLRELAVFAYKKFYGDPRNWPAVIRQLGKPRVIGRSIQKVMGG